MIQLSRKEGLTGNYVKGKMRKVELWLTKLIDTYAAAKKAGVAEAVLKEAMEAK